MLVMDNRYSPGMRKWNLRFGITSRCNIRCRYCLPAGPQGVIAQPSLTEAIEMLQAAYDIRFRRVHYTGGEPTTRRDFLDILRAAHDIGYVQQIVTTNGYRLHSIIEEAGDAGLTRAIISIDTLDEQQNLFVGSARQKMKDPLVGGPPGVSLDSAAEGMGFEPMETRRPQRLSRPPHSSALATFRPRD
jgi:GTP 3',8-cyclase